MQTLTLLPIIKKCLLTHKLRPEIKIDTEPSNYSPNCQDKTVIGKQFFAIHFYWSETYFDTLQGTDKLKSFQQSLTIELIPKIPTYHSHEWGASDGHLFIYITIS